MPGNLHLTTKNENGRGVKEKYSNMQGVTIKFLKDIACRGWVSRQYFFACVRSVTSFVTYSKVSAQYIKFHRANVITILT
jgi:hypothetical protein